MLHLQFVKYLSSVCGGLDIMRYHVLSLSRSSVEFEFKQKNSVRCSCDEYNNRIHLMNIKMSFGLKYLLRLMHSTSLRSDRLIALRTCNICTTPQHFERPTNFLVDDTQYSLDYWFSFLTAKKSTGLVCV